MISLLSLAFGAIGCSQKPVPTEHGWKTNRVVVTRETNDLMGQFAKFEFPENLYDSDRAEVSDFFDMNGGNIFQGGGSPGAPAYVVFPDINDAAALDVKLKAILPALDDLMAHLDNDAYMREFQKKYKAWDLAHNPQWPDTTPPDKRDPNWEFNNNLSVNGVQYKKVEVSPGKWQWQVNEAAMKQMRDYENRRAQLFIDLSMRKLTHAELMQVDTDINITDMQTYFAVDKYAELYDALVKQWELQKGRRMDGYRPLSTAKGEYNRTPQEDDSRRAVEDLIAELQHMTDGSLTKQ